MSESTTNSTKPKSNTGFAKPMNLSPALQAVIGEGPMPRTEVTKAIWVYIKANDLQDPEDKRTIVADDKMREVFRRPEGYEVAEGEEEEEEVDKVNMFQMTKRISRHLS